MRDTPDSSKVIRELRAERKFVEEEFYPGAPNEEIRFRCQSRVDQLIDDLLVLLERDASKEEIFSRAKATGDSFAQEDTEEREKVYDYIGEMMRSLGLDDWADYI